MLLWKDQSGLGGLNDLSRAYAVVILGIYKSKSKGLLRVKLYTTSTSIGEPKLLRNNYIVGSTLGYFIVFSSI